MVSEPAPSIYIRKKRRWVRLRRVFLIALSFILLGFNISASLHLTAAEPDDGKVYSQIAKNIIALGVYSTDSSAPFEPTIIRLPGYPLLIAGTYSAFGIGNDDAVHVIQGVAHFLSAFVAGLLAFSWCGGKRRRRRASGIAAFVLAGLCPFTLVYTGVLLTETVTMCLMAAVTLAATLALITHGTRSFAYWAAAGLLAGLAAEFRPEAGLFAAGVGATLIIASFSSQPWKRMLLDVLVKGVLYGVIFVLVLTPWTVRNYRVFGLFQPIAPPNAEMPDEFVPHGYYLWLRTWLTDIRFVNSMEWALEKQRIDTNSIPESAFGSDDERARVTELIDQYNNSDPDHPIIAENTKKQSDDDESMDDSDKGSDDADSDNKDTAGSEGEDEPQEQELDLKITPEADAAFAQIANERIERDPLSFYLKLPAERMANMWFDTHAEYYPFAGELFPIKDLDSETYQNLWLPLFIGIVWLYTILAFFGFIFLLFSRRRNSWIFLAMMLLVIVPRAIFISWLEDPEPRYFVEYFVFAAVLAGIALSRLRIRCGKGRVNISLFYGRE